MNNNNNNVEIKDKRLKREMANSNERRRMQSINAGFQRLKRLLPLDSSEKLSKANILQQAAEFVQQIEREKLLLHEQNTLLRSILSAIKSGTEPELAMDKLDLDALPVINPRMISNINDTSTPSSTASTTPAPATRPATITTIETTTTNSIASPPTAATIASLPASSAATTTTPTPTTTTIPTATHAPRPVSPNRANSTLTSSSPTHSSDLSVSAGVAKAAKAAIALPLEVPYTSETATTIDHHHHQVSGRRKLLKIEPMTTDSPEPKGQTLDTICKAILEIEGDRVFKE